MQCVFWYEDVKSINIQAIMFQGVPYPGLQKRDKPRRVELYFSSWVIRAGKSLSVNLLIVATIFWTFLVTFTSLLYNL